MMRPEDAMYIYTHIYIYNIFIYIELFNKVHLNYSYLYDLKTLVIKRIIIHYIF